MAFAQVSALEDPLVQEVVSAVRRTPTGLSGAALRSQIRARGSRVLDAVRAAVEEGLIFEGIGSFPTKNGSRRSGPALFPQPSTGLQPAAGGGDWVRQERERLHLSQRALARRMGVHPTLVVHWEAGRQPVAAAAAARVRAALAEGPGPVMPTLEEQVADVRPRLVAAVASRPGSSRQQLFRQVGYGKAVLVAIKEALSAGEIHVLDVRRSGRSGGTFAGYFFGPRPALPAPPAPGELRRARAVARWPQWRMAELCGVEPTTYARWESDEVRIPTWGLVAAANAVRRARAADPMPALLQEVREAVKRQPGIRKDDLVEQLRPAGPSLIREAIARAQRDGSLYASRGLYPGPAPKPLRAGELRRRREQLGWKAHELAAELDVSSALLSAWESGRVWVAPHRVAQLRALFDSGATTPLDARKRLLLEAIMAEPGQTREDWTRRRFGRGELTARALDLLESEGLVHRARALHETGGGRRAYRGYFPGPAPTAAKLSPQELKERRQTAGLTRARLAAMVGVAGATLGAWETGKQPLREPWISKLIQALAAAGVAAQPRRDIKAKTAEQLVADAVAAARLNEGLTATELAEHLQGSMQRRLAAVRQAVEAGLLVERTLPRQPGQRTRKGLFPPG